MASEAVLIDERSRRSFRELVNKKVTAWTARTYACTECRISAYRGLKMTGDGVNAAGGTTIPYMSRGK